MKSLKRFVRLFAVMAILAAAPSTWAAANPSTTITRIITWNEWNQALVVISGSPQPSSGYLWFDASTVTGKNLLGLLMAAKLASSNIYISWVDTPDASILGTSANKIAAVAVQ